MSMEPSLDADAEVYFVSTNSDRASLQLFEQAAKACQEAGIEPKRLEADECLAVTPPNSNDIYIIDNFASEIYNHLLGHNARIRGAPCVLHCLQNSEDLPGEEHPVYSMCMAGAIITLTGVPTAQRLDVVKKIQWLGGTFTKSLVKSTSHLIAQEVSSKKYQAAIGLNIPILTLDWLNDSYEKSKTSVFDAKDRSFLKSYVCPMFMGCVVTTSSVNEKEKIRQIIEKGGGRYSGQMTYKDCTHLVIEKPQGQKYLTAQKWGSVCIVSPLWVHDCERLGYKASEEESKYSVSKGVSTPEKDQFPLPNLPDVSAIHSSTFLTSHIDETMSTLGKNRRSSTDTMRTTMTGSRRSSDFDNSNNKTLDATEADVKCDALANCKVCVRGFTDKMTAHLDPIITNCGGTRSRSTVNSDYIVIAQLDADTMEHVKLLRQPVVSSEWLKQVYHTRTLLDVEPYVLYKPIKRRRSSVEDAAPQTKRRTLLPSTEAIADQSMLDPELADASNDVGELLSQYGGEPIPKGGNVTIASKTSKSPSAVSDHSMTPEGPNWRGAAVGTPLNTPYLVKHHKREIESAIARAPFKDLRFHINCLVPEEERESISLMIRTHGGVLIDEQDTSAAFYCVMPLIADRASETSATCTSVSTVWVRACDRACRLLAADSSPLFTSVQCSDATMLNGCVVTTTGLSAHEREAIRCMVTASGGRYVEDLRKFSGAGVPATTHLICESTESAKYRAAKSWAISITNIRWLMDSVDAGFAQPMDSYQPLTAEGAKGGADTAVPEGKRTLASLQTPVHSRVQALRLNDAGVAGKKAAPAAASKHYLSTSILDEPDKSFHMELDLDCFDTPDRKPVERPSKTNETPLDQAMDKYLQIALDKHYVRTPDGSSQPTAASDVLAGTVICLSKKVSPQCDHLASVVTSLGGRILPSYDSSATHLVFQGRATDGEYRAAKRANQHIVCPLWLEKCKAEKARVTESLYPYNYKASKNSLENSGNTPTRRTGRLSRIPQEVTRSPAPAAETKTAVLDTAKEEVEDTQTAMTDTLLVLKQIKSYMKRRLTIPKKPRKSEAKTAPLSPWHQDTTSTVTEGEAGGRAKEPCMDTQSQGGVLVTWDDPTSRSEIERLEHAESELDSEVLAQLDDEFTQEGQAAAAAPASQDQSADYTADTEAEQMETSLHAPTPRVFQFSGFSNEERDAMAAQLSILGAETLITSNFDATCTHIILSKPQRNEKFLCGLVKGLWLLDKSYVLDCVNASSLLPEEDYEWGNPKATHISCTGSSYANAAHRRREKVQNGLGGDPFSDWKAILACSNEKIGSMRKILELGGAQVLPCSELPEVLSIATHAFIDGKKSGLSQADLTSLKKSGVKCLKVEYIPSYLVSGASLDESKFHYSTSMLGRSANDTTISSAKGKR